MSVNGSFAPRAAVAAHCGSELCSQAALVLHRLLITT